MKKHIKIYLRAFGYDLHDPDQYIPSEISEGRAVDVHHIIGRGKGGPDTIENLMAVTRKEHRMYGDKVQYMRYLFDIHERRLQLAGVEYDSGILDDLRKRYLAI